MKTTRLRFETGSISASGSYTSDPLDMTAFSLVSLQIVKTGTGAGNFKLEKSNDGTNWEDVASATSINTGAQVLSIEKADFAHSAIRAVITETGGSAAMSVVGIFLAKAI